MKPHEIILKMIEEVDPNDVKVLDEIDARVWCFNINVQFVKMHNRGFIVSSSIEEFNRYLNQRAVNKYTRSRDVLKAIRPNKKVCWLFFNNYPEGARARAEIFHDRGDNPIQTDWLATEELAELHAIIQAIAYERGL